MSDAAPESAWQQIRTILIAILIALTIRAFIVEPFRIPSGSMFPTLLIGDHLFVNKFVYGPKVPFSDMRLPGLREPERGDIIVFTVARRQANEILLNENIDFLAVREQLLALNRHLVACRPCKHGRFGQAHGNDRIGQERARIDTRRTAFENVLKLSSARERRASTDEPVVSQCGHLDLSQPEPNRIVTNSEFH